MNRDPSTTGATLSKFFRVAPFFLPFAFSLIPPLSIISPIPLFILTLRNELRVSLLALAGNLLFIALLRDPLLAWVAGLYWFSIGVFFPALIRKTGRIQFSATLSYFFQISAILLGVSFLAKQTGLGIEDFVRSEISIGMDAIVKEAQGPVKELIATEGREGLFKMLMSRIPAGILIALLLSFWINLLFVSQILKGFLSRTFWTRYRTPDWLVWPTLACGALYLFTDHAPYLIGLNGFQLFMTFYTLQGFSILSFAFHRLGVHEFFRFILYALLFFLALPLVAGLGFFDLWFDFRRKFGQT
jgi:hypothetical protein